MMRRFGLLLLALLMTPALAAQTTVDGFTADSVIAAPSAPRAFAFSPANGNLFYCEFDTGDIEVVGDPTGTPSMVGVFATVSDLLVSPGTDLGLIGIAFDPNYATNRYIYVAHTSGTTGNPTMLVKRFTADSGDPNVAEALSETTVYGPITLTTAAVRNGGAIAFGPDGMLYLAMGDAGGSASAGGGRAQTIGDLRGKILRLDTSTTPAGIPADNPTVGSPVFALGLREPLGLAFHPDTLALFAPDTGESGEDEINRISAGANLGWDANGLSGAQATAGYTDPVYSLVAGTDPSCVAFHPAGANDFPQDGHRSGILYFGTKATNGAVRRLILHGADASSAIDDADLVSFTGEAVHHIAFNTSDGALYIATEAGFYRLRYTGNTSAADPVASAGSSQTVTEGTAGVTLDASASSDADLGTTLTYYWRQVGGSPTVTLTGAMTDTATFTAPQVSFNSVLTFEVIVADGDGGFDAATVLITVEDVPASGGSTSGSTSSDENQWEEGGCRAGPAANPPALALLLALALALLRRLRRKLTTRMTSGTYEDEHHDADLPASNRQG